MSNQTFEDKSKSLVCINMWAGPGSGKSTTSAGLFYLMKHAKINCELVSEYAKDLTWSGRHQMFVDQDYIFAKQHHKVRRLAGQAKFAIIDSPLAMGLVYMPKDYPQSFKPFVMDVFNTYTNINIFITRVKPYSAVGRNQTEDEARALDQEIHDFIKAENIPMDLYVDGDTNAPEKIFNFLKERGITTLAG